MQNTMLNARTVAIVRDLKVEKRQGTNGEFESKDILVRIAVNRDYKITRQENGKTISEYPTDFWLAKFTGNLAQVFADNCTAKKEDGKLVSRHLLLSGSFENYDKPRKVAVQPQVAINGQVYQLALEVEVPDNNTIFVVDGLTFLDSNPAKAQASAGSGTAVLGVTPIANVQAPDVTAQAPQVLAQAPQVLAQAPQTPVVDANFNNGSPVAPF